MENMGRNKELWIWRHRGQRFSVYFLAEHLYDRARKQMEAERAQQQNNDNSSRNGT